MDAAKINSLVHSLRPNVGGSHAGPSHGDAAFAAKIAAVVVLDDLLHASESDPQVGTGVVPSLPLAPKTGVVVNLSTGVVAAEMAARMASALPPHTGQNAQPHSTPSSTPPAAQVYGLAERLGDASRANVVTGGVLGVPPEDRRASGPAPASPAPAQIEARNDLYAFAPAPMGHSPRPEAIEPRSSVAAAIEQARDSERLAGLHVKGEVEVAPRWISFERLVLGALALGVLLVLFL